MNKKKLLERLEKNIKDFKTLDEKNSMLMLALYQKSVDQLKSSKLQEVKEYLIGQVNYYHQNTPKNEEIINEIIKEYTRQINELTGAYDYLYISAYKQMEKAINNQITAIGDMVEAWDQRDPNSDEDSEKIDNQIRALAQKKINYSAIVDECKARVNWCIQNIEIDMNEIFVNNFFQIAVYKEGFWENLKRKIINRITGKKKFAEVIRRYEKENLTQIQNTNTLKVVTICAMAQGVLQQIQAAEKQIKMQYEAAVQ